MFKEVLPQKIRWKEIVLYLVALALTALLMDSLLHLKGSHTRTVPYGYSGDSLIYSYIIKAIVTKGWFWTNDSLGAPGVMLFRDYPYPDNIQFLLIKVIGWFTGHYALTYNIFYLLTYPLTTICTLYVLRQFGISYAPAVMVSLLYNFSYYHFTRGIHHVMYGTYYMIPLMVMVFLWILTGDLKLKPLADSPEARRTHKRKMIAAIAICLFVGSTGCAYYPFFALTLLPIVGLVMVFRQKNIRAFALPAIFAAVVFFALLLNVTPTLLFRYQYGSVNLGKRVPAESEIYGLKIAQIVLPITDHRLNALKEFRDKYNRESPLNNENRAASLGFIGSVGFLVLIGCLIIYRKSSSNNSTGLNESRSLTSLLDNLSILNGWGVLVATIGGFGTLFAYLVSPQIRSYNRMSAYIAFYSLFAVALLFDAIFKRYFQTNLKQGIFYGVTLVLIILGVLDQTHKSAEVDYKGTEIAYQRDHEYFKQIEAMMPENAMIFQLPIYHFPEDVSTSHMRGYLQSDRLRWSFGAMLDRPIYAWQKETESKSVPEMLAELALIDFGGLYLDRTTPKPISPKLEEQISAILSQKPLISPNGSMVFYSLLEYKDKVRKLLTNNELAEYNNRSLHPIQTMWKKDFYDLESLNEMSWHWSGPNGELQIENPLDYPRKATIEMSIDSPNAGTLQIRSEIFSETFKVTTNPTTLNKTFVIAPGKHTLKFICNAPAAHYSTDTRSLVFRVTNFKLTDNSLADKDNRSRESDEISRKTH